MAYVTQYRSIWSNGLNHRVEVELLLKNGDVVEPAEFTTVDLHINDDSEEGTIIAREAVLTIRGDDDTEITWETFLPNSYDAWKLIVRLGDELQTIFIGFLTPEEGNSPFLDKPYDVTLRATNGLKLLKDVPLSKIDGSLFKGKFTAMEFIAAALSKTLLEDIPIRVYGSIYESSMDDRTDDILADWVSQAKFDHRTFMKDATTFESCYQVLIILLGRHSRLSFWKGRFVIFYSPEHQYRPAGLYYTEYDSEGNSIDANQETEGVGKVGSGQLIYPFNEDQLIHARFGIKSARTEYKFITWHEIPLNNKFERGTLIDALSGGNIRCYQPDDWTVGKFNGGPTSINALPSIEATTDRAYRKSTYNSYGIELTREIVVEKSQADTVFLQSEGIPIRMGDKLEVSFDVKLDFDPGQLTYGSMIFYIVTPTGDLWSWRRRLAETKWMQAVSGGSVIGTLQAIDISLESGDNGLEFVSVNETSPPLPVDGLLYVVFSNVHDSPSPSKVIYANFNMNYIPFVVNGYLPVKGDFWLHSQDQNMIDADSGEILISDSLIYVNKGAIWKSNGTELTDPTWYRLGTGESRHFKELVNIWRFNLAYRRYYKIEGSFTGLFYEPKDDQLNKQLISWHKEYEFTDLDPQRHFILVPPLQMDIGTGNIRAEFQEVLNPANVTTRLETVEELMDRIIQGVNRNDEVEWNAEGAAPPAGTAGFPPIGTIFTPNPRQIGITLNEADEATAAVNVNGAGNSPSITEFYNEVIAPGIRFQIFELGADIAEGNIFTIIIYDVAINVTVREITLYADGSQLGDTQIFNYIF